jgi:hypothetical protein
MENKKIFCILSYCNTEEKLQALHDNILRLKQYNYSILLYSYLKVPEYISELVDYLIIDKDNPIISRDTKALWWYLTYDSFQLEKCWDDTSWTAINQIQQICKFLESKDYNYHIFLNYDLIMSPDKFQEWLIHQDNSFAGSSLDGDFDRSSLIFFILDKEDLKYMSHNISLEDYLSKKDGRMAEDYFHDKVIERNILFNPNIRFSDSIKGFFGNVPHDQIFNYLHNDVSTFRLFFNNQIIILYNIVEEENITINVNDIDYNIDLKVGEPYYLNIDDKFDYFDIKYKEGNKRFYNPKDSYNIIRKIK